MENPAHLAWDFLRLQLLPPEISADRAKDLRGVADPLFRKARLHSRPHDGGQGRDSR